VVGSRELAAILANRSDPRLTRSRLSGWPWSWPGRFGVLLATIIRWPSPIAVDIDPVTSSTAIRAW